MKDGNVGTNAANFILRPKPMANSTSNIPHPSEKSLLFIRTFARSYNPKLNNESEARTLARTAANTNFADC